MANNRLWILIISASSLFASCQQPQNPGSQAAGAATESLGNFKKITVQEVLQTSQYTYLRGRADGEDKWVAVTSMQAKPGDVYYYEGGLQMTKFESKELNRVFESIILLDKINTKPEANAVVAANTTRTQPAADNNSAATASPETMVGEQYKRTPPKIERQEVKVSVPQGGVTIADLYSKKESFAGKTVKIKGKVTKYTPAVMNKNWIHIQDGTEHGGKFDLAITSDAEVKVGDEVTFEGKIALNKDLGYGYFFDVIMEEATVKN